MATEMLDSFGAVYAALDRPRGARRVVFGLLVIHTCLLAYSAYVHSPTLNEPGHLVAGLSHWKFGRFDIYNVNPPLVKMVAALPVMAVGYNEDWSGFYEGPGARPEMGMGADFVAANGERSFFLFTIARWACIPFSWVGAIICYLWARDLYGRPSGVMACAIWCFEPNILAHASLITADVAGTALGLAACYTFWRWLKNPIWTQAVLTGVVLGLAELAKTTLIIFYPLWPLMWLIYRWPDRATMVAREWLSEGGMLIVRMMIGLYVLNVGYGFEGSFTHLKDFHFVSDLFRGVFVNSSPMMDGPEESHRLDVDAWIAELPVPFPKDYLLGIDLQQKDFEHGRRSSYLREQFQDHGWWYYYLYACAIKVPLGLWMLGIITLIVRPLRSPFRRLGISGQGRQFVSLPATSQRLIPIPRDGFVLLFPALVIFVVVSSKTGFSEHMRYVLPTFPFFFIAISQVCQIFEKPDRRVLTTPKMGVDCGLIRPARRFRFVPLFSASLVGVLASWFITSSLWIYPHSLSYFNELIGGPLNGPRHLLGSNVDCGQDLLYLKKWTKQQPDIEQLFIAYFGNFDPMIAGFSESKFSPIAKSNLSWDSQLSIANRKISTNHISPDWYVTSVNVLYDSSPPRHRGGFALRVEKDLTRLFRELPCYVRAGYSIYIFKLARSDHS